MATAEPPDIPSNAKRSSPVAARTVSRSRTRASREKSSTAQSDMPKPRSSYRTTVAISPSWSRKCRQTGLCQSCWRWLSQQETTTNGGPLPWIAYAKRSPSSPRQNRIGERFATIAGEMIEPPHGARLRSHVTDRRDFTGHGGPLHGRDRTVVWPSRQRGRGARLHARHRPAYAGRDRGTRGAPVCERARVRVL